MLVALVDTSLVLALWYTLSLWPVLHPLSMPKTCAHLVWCGAVAVSLFGDVCGRVFL